MFDDLIGFSKSDLITPNMISFFHVFVAILAGRLVAFDSLGYRRVGVVLFQVRTFLDDLDGHVARVKRHIRGERSEIGTMGYYVDGICDGLGCIALMVGVFVFLRNNVSYFESINRSNRHLFFIFSLHVADTLNCNQLFRSRIQNHQNRESCTK